jgi:hypothetical protein
MSMPATRVPRPIVVPGLSMALEVPLSILTGLTTFHLPFGIFWNDAHGALPVWAHAAPAIDVKATQKAAPTEPLIMKFASLRNAKASINISQVHDAKLAISSQKRRFHVGTLARPLFLG